MEVTVTLHEPPYAERHVGWCERTGSQLMAIFLLDYSKNIIYKYTTPAGVEL